MPDHIPITNEDRPAGYAELIERYELKVVPNHHRSFVATRGPSHKETVGGTIHETYVPSYWPGDTVGDHLKFALRYDGTNLGILAALFAVVDEIDLLKYITEKPSGIYTHRIWFLYEFLTGNRLPLDDLARGNYVLLIDPTKYYTLDTNLRSKRHRIVNNLLGNKQFCPTIRRTDTLDNFEKMDLSGKCKQVLSAYSPELLKRALRYLYTKETKSSFEIEHIQPDSARTERFVALLHRAEIQSLCEDKAALEDVHSQLIDPRFRTTGYRTNQNYVGQTVAWRNEHIHCIFPKPEDIQSLMSGLIESHKRLNHAHAPAVMHAAAIAYGFVFLHPFDDGNGRIHRLLIHNILAMANFTPEGIMFPISAAMLSDSAEYDRSLEAFSRPLMELVDYKLNEDGIMTVLNDTQISYRYIDMTIQTETLYKFIEHTVETDLIQELTFLVNYDRTKAALQDIVDMPDRLIDLFNRFCLQNHGRLSTRKTETHFHMLTPNEITQMEAAVKAGYADSTARKDVED